MRPIALIACALLARSAMAEASGQIVGTDGAPIPGVEVCGYKNGQRVECVTSDGKGFYRMEKPVVSGLFVNATGYVPKMVSAAPQNEPVILERAATLHIVVVDAATGRPAPKGTIEVYLPSGRKLGSPVPFNKAGVKMTTMPPGEAMVRALADGYEPAGPIVVKLVSGKQTDLTIPIKRAAKP